MTEKKKRERTTMPDFIALDALVGQTAATAPHRIAVIDDERQLDDPARVSWRQFGRKRYRHQRCVVGAHRRLERHQALVLDDLRVVEKHLHEVGPGIRLLVGLSESVPARRAHKREAGEGLSSGEVSRHRSASVPRSVG